MNCSPTTVNSIILFQVHSSPDSRNSSHDSNDGPDVTFSVDNTQNQIEEFCKTKFNFKEGYVLTQIKLRGYIIGHKWKNCFSMMIKCYQSFCHSMLIDFGIQMLKITYFSEIIFPSNHYYFSVENYRFSEIRQIMALAYLEFGRWVLLYADHVWL